jgi:hypothetical protein
MKEGMIKLSYFLVLIWVIGCNTKSEILKSVILYSDCHWDVHDKYSASNLKIGYCYKFGKDGSCSYLFYDRHNVRNEYSFDDVIMPKKWSIQGDTTIYIMGLERRVISYSKDTILIKNASTQEEDTLIRNCK